MGKHSASMLNSSATKCIKISSSHCSSHHRGACLSRTKSKRRLGRSSTLWSPKMQAKKVQVLESQMILQGSLKTLQTNQTRQMLTQKEQLLKKAQPTVRILMLTHQPCQYPSTSTNKTTSELLWLTVKLLLAIMSSSRTARDVVQWFSR